MENIKINVAISSLRMLPFRFDTDLRKVLNNINSQIRVIDAIATISNILFCLKNKKISSKSIVK